MGNNYIGKTYPKEETIVEHTEKLIENYDVLKELYPKLDLDWDILKLACLYHDLGKSNRKFQDKIRGKKVKGEIPHGFLSTGFIDTKKLSKEFSREKVKILVIAVAYHHERNFSYSTYKDQIEEQIKLMKNDVLDFKYDKIPDMKVYKLPSLRYLNGDRITEKDGQEVFNQYILIKGMLNRLDYAASSHERVEWKNDFLEDSMDKMMLSWRKNKPDSKWNDLQNYMIENREDNVIVVAQTGMGKTEAGFLWIGNNKGFFTLPLKTAINSIYDRTRNDIVKEKLEKRLGLLHSDAFSEYIKREDDDDYERLQLEELEISKYNERTKQLTMPLTICTIDQLFDFVYRYKGFEHKLATLAYSKLVIDEIQMYSSDLIAYLVSGLSHITELGGKFAILTATFPPLIEDLLKKENIKFKKPEPFIDIERTNIRHSIKVKNEEINTDFIIDNYENNKIIVICNTVKKAQELYEDIKNKREDLRNHVKLFHSSFIKKDRAKKENEILKLGNKNNKRDHGIWICTQVAEASLDIDFDILITELSDLNGLFQRMGRCYRSRPFEKEGYNCFVFNGGNRNCSGIGNVIDEKIFELSKKALLEQKIDGKISEEDKINLIDNLYTTENLKDTDYYKDIIKTLNYIKILYTNEMEKIEAKKMFRNINSVTVIPEEVFNACKEEIEKFSNIINEKLKQGENKEELKKRKAKARSQISNYTVSIPYYLTNNKNMKTYEINKFERIQRFNCKYNEDIGIVPVKDLVYEDELDDWNNFF